MSTTQRQPRPPYPPKVRQLLGLSGRRTELDTWLTGAESSIGFLQDNAQAEQVVLYATLPHVFIHGMLAPLKQLKSLNHSELGSSLIAPRLDATWCIEHTSGGGRPDRVYLASPLCDLGATLKGGEILVFRRPWPAVERTPTEISQKLTHSLGLHYVEERNAYCRIDELGDIEDVINIYDYPSKRDSQSILVITITRQEFYTYAVLAGMGIVFFYDFTRYRPGFFTGWSNQQRYERSDQGFVYHGGVQPGVGSYTNGRQIVFPPTTKREIMKRYKERRNPKKRHYAMFKALDLKTKKHIEVSCDPAGLSNYFQRESDLPLEMSPVFFRAEVVHKYKSDPSKYELTDRSINCRGAWDLETYDINEAGQFHTYLRYLAYLPYPEQLYWQSFNEWPKGPLSRRAILNDFAGEFDMAYDPLDAVKRKVERLDEVSPAWWSPRGKELARVVHYPVTDSETEWANAILAMDQYIIEGFQEKPLKEMAIRMEIPIDKGWRSLKLTEVCLIGKGAAKDHVQGAVDALRRVHELRTIVKGHAALQKKADEEKEALTVHGSFRAHFKVLASGCDDALGLIMTTMDVDKH